jgi:MFS family permease
MAFHPFHLFNRSYRYQAGSADIVRQLDIVIISGAIGTILFSNAGGAAFTGYASSLGAGEFVFGLISALPVMASLTQILASVLVEKTGRNRFLFLLGGIVQRSLWTLTAFIPYFLPESLSYMRVWILLSLITCAAVGGSFVNVTHVSMLAQVIPIGIRGRYITTRQRIITISSLCTGLVSALVLDHVAGYLGYTLVFFVGGIAGIADILCYIKFQFPVSPKNETKQSLGRAFADCFKSPKTRNFLLYWGAWSFANNLAGPFFNKYAIEYQHLSYTQIILFGQITCNILAVFILSRWGRFIDRYGCVPLLFITATASALGTLVWLPAKDGSIVPLLLFNILGGFVWCGNDVSAVNMQMSHTPNIGRSLALATYAVITSVCSAIAFISGGLFLELVGKIEKPLPTLFGLEMDHYKWLFMLSFCLRLSCLLILPKVWNEKEMTLKQAYASLFKDARTIFTRGATMIRYGFRSLRKRR